MQAKNIDAPSQKPVQDWSDRTPVPTGAVNIVRMWNEHQLHVPDRDDVFPWELGLEKLDAGRLYWHVTQATDGGAHVRPVFAVVCDGVLCSTSSATARKTERLARDARCTLATSTDDMDFVYEGVATRVHDVDRAERIARGLSRQVRVARRGDRRRHLRGTLRRSFSRSAALPRLRLRADHRSRVRHRRAPGLALDALGLRPMTAALVRSGRC